MRSVSGGIDGIGAVFDDGSLVADAGLLLAGTVMSRLGLEALIDDTVRPGGSAGSGAGRKVLSLVASMLVGGRCIDDVTVVAPSSSRSGMWGRAPVGLPRSHRWVQGHLRQDGLGQRRAHYHQAAASTRRRVASCTRRSIAPLPLAKRPCCMLQSFPADYQLSLRKGRYAAAELVGNALPPEFVRRHALALRHHFESRVQTARSVDRSAA